MGLAHGDEAGAVRGLRAGTGVLVAVCLLALGASQARAAVECGDTITQDRKLKKNLIDCPATGLIIGAPNVTVDLNGHRLDGVGDSNGGILNSAGHDNVVIKGSGGRITAFGRGVEMNGTAGSRIRGVKFSNNDSSTSAIGIFLNNSTGVVVRGNRITEMKQVNAAGIVLQGTHETDLIGNEITSIAGGASLGIRLSLGSTDNLIDSNVVRGVGSRAILIVDSDGNRILRNRVIRGRDRGVEITEGSDDTLIKRNILIRNEDGVLVPASMVGNGTRIIRNVARRSEEDGIEVDIADAAIGRNLVVNNADWGIEAEPGVTDLGGNRAAGNGEGPQCLNVACGPP